MDHSLFSDLTAWFSESVNPERKQLWRDFGGEFRDVTTAQYVFSDSATADDVMKVFHSESYLRDHLAVFHSAFIDECIRKGDLSQVVIGTYYLPTATVKKEFAGRLHLKYNEEDEGADILSVSCESHTEAHKGKNHAPQKRSHNSLQDLNTKSTDTDYQPLENFPTAEGEITEFVIGQNNCYVDKIS